MIIFEQTFRALLIGTNLVERRVFLMRAPQVPAEQQKLPYFVFFPVGPLPLTTHNGPVNQIQRDYQVSIFDKSQSRALAIGDSLRAAINTLHGDFLNVHIGSCFYMTQTWNWEQETKLFHVIQEYRVMFNYLGQTATQPAVPTAVSPEGENAYEHHTDHADARRAAGAGRRTR